VAKFWGYLLCPSEKYNKMIFRDRVIQNHTPCQIRLIEKPQQGRCGMQETAGEAEKTLRASRFDKAAPRDNGQYDSDAQNEWAFRWVFA
jgi:hypothetical protein